MTSPHTVRAIDSVTATTVVAVSPATAFEVFTDEVDLWWRQGPRFRFHHDHSGTLRFERGEGGEGARLVEVFDEDAGDEHEVGRVLAWEPAKRLVFEFKALAFEPGESTEVEVRFEPESGGTRVSIEHRGWGALREDHPVRHGLAGKAFKDLMSVWWGDQLFSAARRATEKAEQTERDGG